MELAFTTEFAVRYHELDNHGNIQPVTLLNWLQDAAGMHARRLGVSVIELRKLGLTWVLSRIHLQVECYPRADQIVQVRTWPASREGLFSSREFVLTDDQGGQVGRASTSWAVVNVATRRPVRLNEHLPPYPLLPERALEDDFASLPVFPASDVRELDFRVQRSDLDSNQHVNNTVYAGWALEAAPDEVAAGRLTELEIAFRAEALYGDSIVSRCSVVEAGEETCCLHQIIKVQDGRELARLRTRWKE
jgi:medium-chain acyl-[acyl-carrier-protein] hydrolase